MHANVVACSLEENALPLKAFKIHQNLQRCFYFSFEIQFAPNWCEFGNKRRQDYLEARRLTPASEGECNDFRGEATGLPKRRGWLLICSASVAASASHLLLGLCCISFGRW